MTAKKHVLKENIQPIKESGQLKFIPVPDATDPESLPRAEFSENISIRFVNGHTNAMMLPQISLKIEQLFSWPT